MNKKISIILVAFMILATTSIVNAAELKLVQKNPSDWTEIIGGKSVTLTYNEEGSEFIYSGDGFVPLGDTPYTLIYYGDIVPTGTTEAGVVAIKIANNDLPGDFHPDGAIHLEGSKVISTIPYPEDANSLSTSNGGNPGAKLWLVPTSDIVDGKLNWAHYPDGYLFEENMPDAVNGIPSHLINFKYLAAGQTTGSVTVKSCPVGTIGVDLTPDSLGFGELYPGQSTNVSGTVVVSASGFVCEQPPTEVSVSFSATEWSSVIGNSLPAESTVIIKSDESSFFLNSPTLFPVGTSNIKFKLNLPSEAVPDVYSQTITVTQIS